MPSVYPFYTLISQQLKSCKCVNRDIQLHLHHRIFTDVVNDIQVMRKSITVLNIYTIYRLWATVFNGIQFSPRFKAFVIYISVTWPCLWLQFLLLVFIASSLQTSVARELLQFTCN